VLRIAPKVVKFTKPKQPLLDVVTGFLLTSKRTFLRPLNTSKTPKFVCECR